MSAGRGPRWRIVVAGAATALLFGIHPVHVESVAWVSERKDLLCAVFFLGSLLAYLPFALGRSLSASSPATALRDRSYFAALGLFALALMSKPMAVTLPAILVILDWVPLRRIRRGGALGASVLEKLPFLALSLASSVVTFIAQRAVGAMGDVPPPVYARAIVAAHAPAAYLLKMVAPFGLSPFYPYPMDIALVSARDGIPVLFTAAATLFCIALARRNGVWLAAWGYYLVTLLPVTGLVAQVGIQLLADRYTYLPSLGPFVLAGAGAAALAPKRAAGVAAALVVATLLGVLTVRQIGIWRDGFALWTYVIEREPERVPSAYVNRGSLYLDGGQLERAVADFDRALALEPVRWKIFLNPGHFREAFVKRASAYQKMGQHEDAAIRDYEKALESNPSDLESRISLGILYGKVGSLQKSIEQFDKAAEISPSYPIAYGNRGYAYALLGRNELALADLDKAIALDPRYASAYLKRGNLLLKTGNVPKARADLEAACRLGSQEACAAVQALGS
jgi:tetratricopeptide (TPR) repeat protein